MSTPFSGSFAGRPGPAVTALLVANVAAYVLELILFRATDGAFVDWLALRPLDFWSGRPWQLVTYMFLHSPAQPGHLLFNLLFLFWFGRDLESWWGSRRFTYAYFLFGVSGGLLTVLVAAVTHFGLIPILPDFAAGTHLGASGAVTGLTLAWGLTAGDRVLNFFLLGPIRGITFCWIMVGIELLTALSLAPTSSTAHFGGMIAAFVVLRGLYRPRRWVELFRELGERRRRDALLRKKKAIEAELKVIQGGKKDGEGGPKLPN